MAFSQSEIEWALRAAKFSGAERVEIPPGGSPMVIPSAGINHERLGLFDRGDRVYVLCYGPYTKIGFSSNVGSRIQALQDAAPETLSVVSFFPGDRADERRLFKRFADYRLRGEWFSYGGALKSWIDDGCDTEAVGLGVRVTYFEAMPFERR